MVSLMDLKLSQNHRLDNAFPGSHRSKGIGDPTSELFHDLPVKYNEIIELAKDRVKQ